MLECCVVRGRGLVILKGLVLTSGYGETGLAMKLCVRMALISPVLAGLG